MTEPVTIRLPGGGRLDGAIAVPAKADHGDGPHPGVVVLHEVFGLNDDMRRITDRFAANGYVAIAPDLYSHGNRALCLTRVLLSRVSDPWMKETLGDIEAAREHLASLRDVDATRVAIAGFCLGGGLALLIGTTGSVKAAAVHYGSVPRDVEELRGVCPVLGTFGARDSVFAEQAERLEQHLTTLRVPHDVKTYDGVGHSFLSYDNAPAWVLRLPSPLHPGYSEPDAEHAWDRMLRFFKEHVT